MSTHLLAALLVLLLVVTIAATVTLVSLLVTVTVQAYRDRRLERALVASQQEAARPGGTPTAPVGLIGRLEAWSTGVIPVVGRDTPGVMQVLPGPVTNPGTCDSLQP